MIKRAPKSAMLKRIFKAGTSALTVVLLALSGLTVAASSANAVITLDVLNSTFNFDYPTNGTTISAGAKETTGSIVKYSNVTTAPVSGVNIDAVVTMTLNNSEILPVGTGISNGTYDSPGKAGTDAKFFQVDTKVTGAYGYASFKFDFYEAGTYTGLNTGTPVVLKNLSVTTIDIDGGSGYCQYTDFTGFQKYYLGANSSLLVKTNANDPTNVPAGVTRFYATSCTNNSNRIEDAAQVTFDAASTFTARVGTNVTSSPNYFGFGFKTLSSIFGGTQPAPVSNPSNQPPTSSNTTRYYVNGQPELVQLADFGIYSDPDGNPFQKVMITSLPTSGTLEKFVNGSWVAVSVNDEILVSDITNGNLRFTGSSNTSLQFKVSDGNAYSTSAYTMSLLVSNQSQTITFTNPGAKTPTTPAFASGATASSGLTVTLTSLTPGVCTVSGLNIVPVTSGTCTIVASQSGNTTYGAATPVTQTFPISTLTSQTITAPNPGNQNWSGTSSTINVTPTASSNLTVNLVSLNPAVCSVSGFVITIVGPGNCTIRNTQPGNGTYSAAPPVEYTFVVAATPSTYTVTYNGNNNYSGTVPAVTTGNGSVTLRGNSGTLARSGYTLTGWNSNAAGTGTHYDLSSAYNLNADVTLYAEWTADSVYTITYTGNGNTGGSIPSHTTGNGSVTLEGNTGSLERTGYTLTGWNTNAGGTGTHYDLADAYNLTANVTLYAEWTAIEYTILYDGNTNDAGASPSNTVGYGSVTLRGNTGSLSKSGFTLTGWNTQADGQGTHYALSSAYTLSADVTIYAEWTEITYTITYNGNSKTSGSAPGNTTGNGSVTLASNPGSLSRTGYSLSGWNTNAAGTGTHLPLGGTYNLTSNVTLYAEWTALVFTLTFDGNTSVSGLPPVSITGYGNKTLPGNTGTLVKTNYTFKGWNTAADGSGTRHLGASTFNLIADTTLYAEWVLTPQVIYNGNGSTGGTTPGAVDQGSPITIDPNTGNLIRTGFRFLGWNTQPDGSGTAYAAGDTPNLPIGTVLYAQWQPVESLAGTGSESGNLFVAGSFLLGLGLFLNAVARIRRRRA